MVSQGGFLFEGTLRDNLDPFHLIRKDKIQRVLQKGADILLASEKNRSSHTTKKDHIERLFEEEFYIEKSGRNLSNGEKQIINFLRILLRDSELIILDEATSNVDPVTGMYFIELMY